jgi:hypothetical protein
MDNIPISKTLGIKECGYDELWLQNQIWDNPNSLDLGELEGVTREKIISSGGKLDILLKNPSDDSMFEVEIMLGETDPSHIIRTIEYWDLIKRKWPQRQHFAVLVAEKITKRFFNVIQILSNSVPLIAIQANIIDINGVRSLHFTKILDTYEEPEDDMISSNEIFDKNYWNNKAEAVLKISEKLKELTDDIYKTTNLIFNKGRISINCEGYNQMSVHKRTGDKALIVFRYGDNKEEIIELLDTANIPYNERTNDIKMTMNYDEVLKNEIVIKKIAELNYRWWQ